MKRIKILTITLFATTLLFGEETSFQVGDTSRVLFIGNSYTYFWNLPQHVSLMAESKGIPLMARQSTAGGSTLGNHWKDEKGLRSRDILSSDAFDIVIIQDHSMRTINAPDSLHFYGEKLGQMIKDQGAEVYLYMTWARQWDPYMIKPIEEQYKNLAEQLGATIVPVGLAWKEALRLRPGIPLFDSDGSHPSPSGTYLTACVFFTALTGESPIGLPERLVTEDKAGEKLYINIQSKEDALFYQKVAHEVVLNHLDKE